MASDKELLEALRNLGKSSSLDRLLSEEQQDVTKYLEEASKKLVELANAVTTAKTSLEENQKALEQQAKQDQELFNKYNAEFEKLIKAGTDSASALKTMMEQMDKNDELGKRALTQLEERLKLEKALENAEKEALEAKKAREKEKNMLERVKTSAQSNIGGMFGTLGIKFEGDPENMNALYMGLKLIGEGETQKGMRLLSFFAEKSAEAFSNMIDPLNIFVNMLGQVKTQFLNVFTAVDEVTANFLQATGATADFARTITDSWEQTRGSNLSLQDMSDSLKSLMSGYAGFTLQSKDAREEAVVFNALVTRLGVSSETSTKAFAFFADTLQLGVMRAKTAYSDLLGLVETTGETIEKVSSDFVASLPVLARYGNQAKTVFKDVFATAKALRIETSQLLEVTSQFDTFEDAATSVGKLNAIMGGPYLNAIQMMNQSEAERIATLNSAFKATGRSWEQLGKYGRLALATAAGITDMNLAQKVFTGSTADAARMMRQASLDQEELAEKNKRATSLMEAWKNVLMQIGIVIQPLVDFAHALIGVILDVADAFGSVWEPLRALAIPLLLLATSAILGFKGALVGLVKKLAISIIPGLSKFIGVAKEVAPAAAESAAGIGDVTKNAGKATGPVSKLSSFMGGLGKVFMGIGPVIASIATGIAAAITGIGMALGKVAAPLAIFIALVGGAVALVIGLYKAVTETPMEEMEDLIETVGKAGTGIGKEMEGIGSGMSKLVAGFNKNISQSTVETFTNLVEALAENSSKFTNSFGGDIIDSYTRLLEAASVATITPTSIQSIKTFTDNIVATSNGKPAPIAPPVKKEAPSIEVKIYVDGEELKNSVSKVVMYELGNKLSNYTNGQ